jgi:hypothetical protein
VNDSKTGYYIEIFLKYFKMNPTFLDKEMPVNTNKHFSFQFLKGVYNICVVNNKYKENSPNFAYELVEKSPIPVTLIYFDCIDSELLEYHCFNSNVRSLYHFVNNEKKVK